MSIAACHLLSVPARLVRSWNVGFRESSGATAGGRACFFVHAPPTTNHRERRDETADMSVGSGHGCSSSRSRVRGRFDPRHLRIDAGRRRGGHSGASARTSIAAQAARRLPSTAPTGGTPSSATVNAKAPWGRFSPIAVGLNSAAWDGDLVDPVVPGLAQVHRGPDAPVSRRLDVRQLSLGLEHARRSQPRGHRSERQLRRLHVRRRSPPARNR